MSFEIGERVTSKYCGPGTVTGPIDWDIDEDGRHPVQRVKFDNPLMGERLYPVTKLQTLEPEPEPKPHKKNGIKSHFLERDNPAQEIRDFKSPLVPVFIPLWHNVKCVRVIAPAHLADDAKRVMTDLGIIFPADWRGTAKGKRGGKTVQRSMSAQIQWLDSSKPINDRNLVLKILSEGRLGGWRVTESV